MQRRNDDEHAVSADAGPPNPSTPARPTRGAAEVIPVVVASILGPHSVAADVSPAEYRVALLRNPVGLHCSNALWIARLASVLWIIAPTTRWAKCRQDQNPRRHPDRLRAVMAHVRIGRFNPARSTTVGGDITSLASATITTTARFRIGSQGAATTCRAIKAGAQQPRVGAASKRSTWTSARATFQSHAGVKLAITSLFSSHILAVADRRMRLPPSRGVLHKTAPSCGIYSASSLVVFTSSGRFQKYVYSWASAPVQSLPSWRDCPALASSAGWACQCGAAVVLYNTATRMQRLGAGSAPPISSPAGFRISSSLLRIARFGRRGSSSAQ